ncbi:MAG: DUF2085 domain-containing protein [Candidatus Micrarchaeota archaeon]
MNWTKITYAGYIIVFLMFIGITLAVPILSFENDMTVAYDVFGPLCHQKLSRSFCVFQEEGSMWIDNCSPQDGQFINSNIDRELIKVIKGDAIGFKMPLCSRDMGLYGAMLLAGLIYPFVRKLEDKTLYPSIFLIVALVPIGLDGGVQIISELGLFPIVYESTNIIRLATGTIAGFAATFYALPLLINMVSKE